MTFFYFQEAQVFHRGASIDHDLTSGNYEATYLTNEAGDDWWRPRGPGSDNIAPGRQHGSVVLNG